MTESIGAVPAIQVYHVLAQILQQLIENKPCKFVWNT